MPLYGDKYHDVSVLEAAETNALGRLVKLLARPSLLSLTNAALADPSIDGTKVVLDAFAAGDQIVTNTSLCDEYHRDYVDFATAGDGGGPLDAGDYYVYLDVQDSGGSAARYYKAYPRAATAVDDDLYLVVASVHWNGSDTLSSLTDLRTNAWGHIDLTKYLSGTRGEGVFSADRDLRFAGAVQFDALVRVVTSLVLGAVGAGGLLTIPDGGSFGTGDPFTWAMSGDTTVTPTDNKKFEFDFSVQGYLSLLGLLQHAGRTAFLAYAQATPLAYQLNWENVIRAIAVVDDDGTLLWGYNVSAAAKNATGDYTVTIDRNMADTTYGVLLTGNGTGKIKIDAPEANLAVGSFGVVTHAWNDGTSAWDDSDQRFVAVVVGGAMYTGA